MWRQELIVLLALSVLRSESFELTQTQEDQSADPECNGHHSSEGESLENSDDFNYCSRHFAQCGIVRKIEYFPCSTNANACAAHINLNSACIRCETCLAIVDQINQTLIMIHKRMYPIMHLNDTQIDSLFKIICEYSFSNYALRDIEGQRAILDNIRDANLIVTNVDGQWEEHLKKRCYDLTEEMGRTKLYNYWKLWWDVEKINEEIPSLELVLCRDNGSLFRDCKSIPHTCRQTLRSIENERLKTKISSLFPCI